MLLQSKFLCILGVVAVLLLGLSYGEVMDYPNSDPYSTMQILSEAKAKAKGEDEHVSLSRLQETMASPVAHATIVLSGIFVLISISFELLRDALKRSVPELFQPILHALYSELTNMGLVGILIFLGSNAGDPSLFEYLSEVFLHDEEVLMEQAEAVHMLIFFFMLLLVSFVVGCLTYVHRLALRWEKTELEALSHVENGTELTAKQAQFLALRARFINTCEGVEEDFQFYEYRKICIMEDFCAVVNIQPIDWVFTFVTLFTLWLIMAVAGAWGHFAFIVFLWGIFALTLFNFRSMRQIQKLVHPPKTTLSQAYGTFSATAPLYTLNPEPQPRHFILQKIFGPSGDKHRALFWPGAQGPAWLRASLRVRFLNISIISAIMLTFYAHFLWHLNPLFLILATIPMGAVLVLLPLTVHLLADVTSVEGMKRELIARDVTRHQKIQKSIKILKSLSSLAFLAKASSSGKVSKDIRPRNKKEEQFLGQLREMFNSFDIRKTGSINLYEFRDLMYYFAPSVDRADVDSLFAQMDEAKTGVVEFHQLASVMLANQMSSESKESAKETAEILWSMFDLKGVGEVTIEEVRDILRKSAGDKLKLEHILEFFTEIDKNKSGTVEKKEFLSFVERHVV